MLLLYVVPFDYNLHVKEHRVLIWIGYILYLFVMETRMGLLK